MTRGATGEGEGVVGVDICMGSGGGSDGRGGGVGVVRAPPARSGGGSSARRRWCGGSSTGPRLAQNEACARTRRRSRENGEGGGKGRGDGRRRSLERAAPVEVGGGRKGGKRARDWAGPRGAPRRDAKNRLSRRIGTCQGRGGGGGERVKSGASQRGPMEPGGLAGVDRVARAVGERVLAACSAPVGR